MTGGMGPLKFSKALGFQPKGNLQVPDSRKDPYKLKAGCKHMHQSLRELAKH